MFSSQEGRSVPQVTFHTHQGDQWVEVTSDELFRDQRVIVFSLPGHSHRLALRATYHATTNWRLSSSSMV